MYTSDINTLLIFKGAFYAMYAMYAMSPYHVHRHLWSPVKEVAL